MIQELRHWDITNQVETQGNVVLEWTLLGDYRLKLNGINFMARMWVLDCAHGGLYAKLRTYENCEYDRGDLEVARREVEIVPFVVYETREYIIVMRNNVEIEQQLYIVHASFFLAEKLMFLEGMKDVYAIQSDGVSESDEILIESHCIDQFVRSVNLETMATISELEFRKMRDLDIICMKNTSSELRCFK